MGNAIKRTLQSLVWALPITREKRSDYRPSSVSQLLAVRKSTGAVNLSFYDGTIRGLFTLQCQPEQLLPLLLGAHRAARCDVKWRISGEEAARVNVSARTNQRRARGRGAVKRSSVQQRIPRPHAVARTFAARSERCAAIPRARHRLVQRIVIRSGGWNVARSEHRVAPLLGQLRQESGRHTPDCVGVKERSSEPHATSDRSRGATCGIIYSRR